MTTGSFMMFAALLGASFATMPNAAGGGGDDPTGIRVVLLQVGGAGGDYEYELVEGAGGSATNSIVFDFSGQANSMMMGLDVGSDGAELQVTLSGDATFRVHPLGTPTYDLYEAGTHAIALLPGGFQLVGTGPGSLVMEWPEEVSDGGDARLIMRGFDLPGGSVSYHPGQGEEWIWFHGGSDAGASGGVFSGICSFEASGGPLDVALVWVGDVSVDTFVLPDEGGDDPSVTMPEGLHQIEIGAGGLLGVRIGEGGSDGGDSGGDVCLGDIDGDGQVDGADLTLLLGAWGVCP